MAKKLSIILLGLILAIVVGIGVAFILKEYSKADVMGVLAGAGVFFKVALSTPKPSGEERLDAFKAGRE